MNTNIERQSPRVSSVCCSEKGNGPRIQQYKNGSMENLNTNSLGLEPQTAVTVLFGQKTCFSKARRHLFVMVTQNGTTNTTKLFHFQRIFVALRETNKNI